MPASGSSYLLRDLKEIIAKFRHEFIDCLMIDLLRTEILPFASVLPREFMEKIIEILNKGSINTMDISDVLGMRELTNNM